MSSNQPLRAGALVACAGWIAACAGNGAGLDQSGRPLPPGGSSGGALTADFNSIQQHVFTPICSVCHAGGSAPQGLRLDPANSYALLVGVPSTEVPSVLRVKPGDPDNSYVVQKLEGHAAVGAQMPFGGPPLPASTIAVIRQWISDGAARSAAAAAPATLAVSAAVPAMHDVLFEVPARVVVSFSADLDATRLDASSVRLEKLAAPGEAAQAQPVAVRLAYANPRTLLVEPSAPLADGRYALVIPGAPSTGVAGIDGTRVGASGATPAVDTLVTQFEIAVNP